VGVRVAWLIKDRPRAHPTGKSLPHAASGRQDDSWRGPNRKGAGQTIPDCALVTPAGGFGSCRTGLTTPTTDCDGV
jgi:hypothetical protein